MIQPADSHKIETLGEAMAGSFSEDQAYRDLTRMAADLCQAPIAVISLADGDRMWFKARVGLDAAQIPKESSFCECAMQHGGRLLMVEDASLDARFAGNLLVAGPLGVRFYVGAPLVTSTGQVLGNLAVLDITPRRLSDDVLETLDFLSRQVAWMLEKASGQDPAHPQDVPLRRAA